MNLQDKTSAELKQIVQDAQAILKTREKEDKDTARKAILQMAAEAGLNLSDLVGKGGSTKAPKDKKTVAAKFRSADGAHEWTGRGRQPQWVTDHVANGGTKEDLAIAGA